MNISYIIATIWKEFPEINVQEQTQVMKPTKARIGHLSRLLCI